MSTKLRQRVFLLDDNPIDRESCRRYLAKIEAVEYEFVEHNAVTGAIELIGDAQPDCILLDYHLQDGTGLQFLQQLIQRFGALRFPVIMLTGTGSERIAVEVMKIGAMDYLSKDQLNSGILHRTIETAIYKARTELMLAEQRREMERLFEEAKEANARKDQFLAALSHELRTPLTPVLAAVSQTDFSQTGKDDFIRTYAMIRRNIEVEARLIDDMLDLTRIANGKMDIRRRPVELNEILHHAAEACDEERGNKWLKLEWRLASQSPVIDADPGRIQQVFWNLLKNAIKFTPENGAITVSSTFSGGHVVVEIADTGIGLEPGAAKKIFDAFEQGGEKVTQRFGGLGLGLAISKALVDAHDGTIVARNREAGTGAVFTVTLPLHDEPLDTAPSTPSDQRGEISAGSAKTILLVEDHADSAQLIKKMLETSGYTVVLAGSIREAMELFSSRSIDSVVSDLGLPDGSGHELLTALHAIRKVPAIALSGYGMEEDLRRSSEAGFAIHLTKPIDLQSLFTALHEIENRT